MNAAPITSESIEVDNVALSDEGITALASLLVDAALAEERQEEWLNRNRLIPSAQK